MSGSHAWNWQWSLRHGSFRPLLQLRVCIDWTDNWLAAQCTPETVNPIALIGQGWAGPPLGEPLKRSILLRFIPAVWSISARPVAGPHALEHSHDGGTKRCCPTQGAPVHSTPTCTHVYRHALVHHNDGTRRCCPTPRCPPPLHSDVYLCLPPRSSTPQ